MSIGSWWGEQTASQKGTYAAAGISAASSIATGFMQTSAFKAKVNAMADAAVANMKMATTSYELEQYKMLEQMNELDEVLGDKLSERGLQAIKQQAMLRAAAAESGTSGGTTDTAINEAFMTEHFDRANIIADAKRQKKQAMMSMDVKTQRLKADLAGLASGMPSMKSNAMLSGLAGGLNAVTSTLSLMPAKAREDMFKD